MTLMNSINYLKLSIKNKFHTTTLQIQTNTLPMQKYSQKNDDLPYKQLKQDIQFILSNIQARQNGLIFFLQQYLTQYHTDDQLTAYQEDFLQKQKIYSNQINKILLKYLNDKKYRQYVEQYATHDLFRYIHNFWNKINDIILVSFQRLNILKLVNGDINQKYQQILQLINFNCHSDNNFEEFYYLENLLKKRNIDALIYTTNHFRPLYSDNKVMKNRSESTIKNSKFSPKPRAYRQYIQLNDDIEEDDYQDEQENNPSIQLKFQQKNEKFIEARMKSLNRYRKKKILMQNKTSLKAQQKKYKKITKNIDKIQRCLQGAMDCIIQINIDKKKTIKQNQIQLYDSLFNKNISNHKMISKFIYGICGIAQFLIKKKNVKNKKLLTTKTDKNIKDAKQIDKKIKNRNQKETKDKDRIKEKEKQNKDKQSRQRPQTSLPAHLKSIFEQQKRKMIQTTLLLQEKKSHKYKRKMTTKMQKFAKLIKIAG